MSGSLLGGLGGLVAGATGTRGFVETEFPEELQSIPPQMEPQRAVLTITEDPRTSATITWRTDYEAVAARAEVVRMAADPEFDRGESACKRASAETRRLKTPDGREVFYHSAVFRNLQPGTPYAWRIVEERGYTEWVHFRTACDGPEPFRFIYLGDAQNSLNLRWPRVIRGAFARCPDAQLALHGGDLVNVADSDEEWRDWFAMGGWHHGSAGCLAVPGNHEYGKPVGSFMSRITPFWNAQFRTRPTGMEDSADLRGTAWMLDWQGVRFVGLNSMRDILRQAQWLDNEALADNPNRWTVVMFHHPIHCCVRTRDNPIIRTLWEPILDRHKVDLVLQGHDHAYSRSGKVIGSQLQGNEQPGRVYVTSVSGSKMYRINTERVDLFRRLKQDRQMYHIAEVNGDVLRFESWMADGQPFETFELHKQANGETTLVEV